MKIKMITLREKNCIVPTIQDVRANFERVCLLARCIVSSPTNSCLGDLFTVRLKEIYITTFEQNNFLDHKI